MPKKKPSLWFEKSAGDPKESRFENVEKTFGKPGLGRMSNLSEFRSNSIPVKIGDTDSELLLRAHLPGFEKDEIRLKITPNMAYISAEKKKSKSEKGDRFFRRMDFSSSVSRILELPSTVKTDGVRARYKDGVLEVVMKKRNPESAEAD